MVLLLDHGRKTLTDKRIESVRTPPIPSSSPGPGNDSMDLSPLPHKAPFAMAARIYLTSPTPEATPTEEARSDLPSVEQETPEDPSGHVMPLE